MMQVEFFDNGMIRDIRTEKFSIPFFRDNFGFFIEKNGEKQNIPLEKYENGFFGKYENIKLFLDFDILSDHLKINVKIINGGEDFAEKIGFSTGIDTYMEKYPAWHDKFFPTLLRCEKTHFWGYFMNTAENSVAIATKAPVASYDIIYNFVKDPKIYPDADCGHRILGADIVFFQNTVLPERHPENLKLLKAGEIYENSIFYIPVENKNNIKASLAKIAEIPLVDCEKYTKEIGEGLFANIICECGYKVKLFSPRGEEILDISAPLFEYGRYILRVFADNGKSCEASFFVRKNWAWYLEKAAENALLKPQKATTNCESFYGFFSAFLHYKHKKDEKFGETIKKSFDEVIKYAFDMENAKPITIPRRIQNTAVLISLLCDIYESNPEKNKEYLYCATRFADVILASQDESGAYKNRKTHYTCVVYLAKSMLELADAQRKSGDEYLVEKSKTVYLSAKRAVDELVLNLDNIQTEGEMTLEDGMVSCSALQIACFALTLSENEREKYINAAEYMMKIHSCLEQQQIPDCRMNGASLRYWESQYDVMIRVNMLNSPHGWTAWTGYAKYYLYLLTGKKEYLLSLMNLLGACAQLVDENGNLRWAFCGQPYIKGRAFVPDYENEIADGYECVRLPNKAYRGKYEIKEFSEQYIDMISSWYRTGSQKVTGGYEFCPLILDGYTDSEADRQGGCCDNDVHEIFKCIEECVLKKAYVFEEENGSFLCFGCEASAENGVLNINFTENCEELIYNFKKEYTYRDNGLCGFDRLILK